MCVCDWLEITSPNGASHFNMLVESSIHVGVDQRKGLHILICERSGEDVDRILFVISDEHVFR